MNKVPTRIGNIAFVLMVVFVVLKLFGKISWSWGWGLAPVFAAIIGGGLYGYYQDKKNKKDRR